ncbi:MAG: hypothetical protein MUE44_19495 [Oscillatoriaceae cyanobacterium Prado104]|jgi:hypothetical protein|nr:hypothetical protein [Oscillatoriaceae cyanobacterium Prado104]
MTAKLIQNTSVSKIAEKYRQEGYKVFNESVSELLALVNELISLGTPQAS